MIDSLNYPFCYWEADNYYGEIIFEVEKYIEDEEVCYRVILNSYVFWQQVGEIELEYIPTEADLQEIESALDDKLNEYLIDELEREHELYIIQEDYEKGKQSRRKY